jgi:flavodoxin
MKIKIPVCINIFLCAFPAFLMLSSCSPPKAQRLTPADMSIMRPGAASLVVVHSRTGNTARLGLRIAEVMSADYLRLETPEGYGDSYLSYTGRAEAVPVKPLKADLVKYKLVFLGSPIWFWHPTAFIYTFIKNNDLSDKEVVLFFTNQGGLNDEAIREWKVLVEKQGGTVIDVLGIDRSGFKSNGEFQAKVKELVGKHKSTWNIKSN